MTVEQSRPQIDELEEAKGQESLPTPSPPLAPLDEAPLDEARRPGPLAWLAILFVLFYQRFLSPLFPPSCRYRPTCSQYMLIALRRYGLFRGGWMGLKRIGRCHPFHPGGYDPVP